MQYYKVAILLYSGKYNLKMVLKLVHIAHYSLFLVTAILCFGVASSKVYDIIPAPTDPCPTEFCLTLSQFITKQDIYLRSKTMLIFQPGTHSLSSKLLIGNISMWTMLSNTSGTYISIKIVCNNFGRVEFNSIDTIVINKLTFIGCVENKIMLVSQVTFEDVSFIGQTGKNGVALMLVKTTASLERMHFFKEYRK